jgi:hypothetical protein
VSTPVRRLLVLVAAVSAVLGVGLGWLLFHGSGETRVITRAAASPAATAGSTPASFDQFGLSAQLPHGWGATVRKGVLALAAPDQSVSLTISMAGGRPDVKLVRRADRIQLEKIFHAHLVTKTRSRIGTLPTVLAELAGRSKSGHPIRILASGVTSRWRTYSIQGFTVPEPPAQRALEFDSLVASLRFRAPK